MSDTSKAHSHSLCNEGINECIQEACYSLNLDCSGGQCSEYLFKCYVCGGEGVTPQSGLALHTSVRRDMAYWGYKPQAADLPERRKAQRCAEGGPWEPTRRQLPPCRGQCHGVRVRMPRSRTNLGFSAGRGLGFTVPFELVQRRDPQSQGGDGGGQAVPRPPRLCTVHRPVKGLQGTSASLRTLHAGRLARAAHASDSCVRCGSASASGFFNLSVIHFVTHPGHTDVALQTR